MSSEPHQHFERIAHKPRPPSPGEAAELRYYEEHGRVMRTSDGDGTNTARPIQPTSGATIPLNPVQRHPSDRSHRSSGDPHLVPRPHSRPPSDAGSYRGDPSHHRGPPSDRYRADRPPHDDHHRHGPRVEKITFREPGRDSRANIDDLPAKEGQWSVGLFDCHLDYKACCMGFFCPWCLGCQLAKDLEESILVPCCVPFWLPAYRLKLRMMQNIEGSILMDCLITYVCTGCALCQISNEVRIRRNNGLIAQREEIASVPLVPALQTIQRS